MRISTVREFTDSASGLLRAKVPILVTRRGRLAGIFIPLPETPMPVELKREIFGVLGTEVARQIRRAGLNEEKILADFGSWKRTKRRSGIATKTPRVVDAKSRMTKAGMSRLEGEGLESFKALMKQNSGRLCFAGCDE